MDLRPKALAAYTAVLELMDEGVDINHIKVSQVAERAGMGKGTLYEYFVSKEEMIASAVLYEIQKMTEEIDQIISQGASFEEKILLLLDCMETRNQEDGSIGRFVRLMTRTHDLMSQGVRREMERHKMEIRGPYQILRELCMSARAEGKMREELPLSAGVIAISSRLLIFLIYLENTDLSSDLDQTSVKRFLYQGMLTDLDYGMGKN